MLVETLKRIYDKCEHSLPSYARSMFVRFMTEIPLTETYKQKKVSLSLKKKLQLYSLKNIASGVFLAVAVNDCLRYFDTLIRIFSCFNCL